MDALRKQFRKLDCAGEELEGKLSRSEISFQEYVNEATRLSTLRDFLRLKMHQESAAQSTSAAS